jgi:cytochrome c553
MRALLTILLALTLADYAQACGRCGIFGRGCRFAKVKAAVVYPQYAQQASQTINIANFAYPVGATQYSSVAQISQLYATNPALALEHSTRVAERSVSTMQSAIESLTANNEGVLELAKLQAATEHLRAALTTSQQQSSYTLRITQSSSGITVEPLTDTPPMQGGGPAATQPPASSSLLALHCASCHGTDINAPKAGLYYDTGHQLDASNAMRALRILEGMDVPEAMQRLVAGLSDEDLAGLRSEIIGLTR